MEDFETSAVDEAGAGEETFDRLRVWRDAVELAALVYETFRGVRDLEFRSQIRAAAVSVSSNIAEGYERSSNQEFVRFLDIARGSCGEVRSQAHVAVRVALLTPEQAKPVVDAARLLSKRIARLMTVRRERFG